MTSKPFVTTKATVQPTPTRFSDHPLSTDNPSTGGPEAEELVLENRACVTTVGPERRRESTRGVGGGWLGGDLDAGVSGRGRDLAYPHVGEAVRVTLVPGRRVSCSRGIGGSTMDGARR
jgi:hypothetical protein